MPEVITRLCGHTQAFTPRGDPYDDARREKLRSRNCPECGKKKNEEDNRNQPARTGGGKIKKGQEPKALPPGTNILLVLRDDGSWYGHIEAVVEEAGNRRLVCAEVESKGAMGIMNKLARKWLKLRGAKLQGKVPE